MEEDAIEFIKSNSRLDLKNDYVFKRIFSKPENSHELKELLEAILDIKINKIEVKNPEIPKNFSDEKQSTLDILAYLDDDTVVNIEMQLDNPYTIVNRNVTYLSKLVATDLRVKELYTTLRKFISITLLGKNILHRNSYHSIAHLKFEETDPEKYVDIGYNKEQELLTDRIEYHYIELPKFIKKNPGISKKLEQWLWLFVGEEDKVKMVSEENKSVEKVVEDLDEMSGNEAERWEAFKRRYAEWEYNYTIAQSIAEGKAERNKEIAKKMKEEKIDLNIIIKVTGLTKEEIEEL